MPPPPELLKPCDWPRPPELGEDPWVYARATGQVAIDCKTKDDALIAWETAK